jgi:hypothetical protein
LSQRLNSALPSFLPRGVSNIDNFGPGRKQKHCKISALGYEVGTLLDRLRALTWTTSSEMRIEINELRAGGPSARL